VLLGFASVFVVSVVFWANTVMPDKSDKPSAAVMIILIFLGSP